MTENHKRGGNKERYCEKYSAMMKIAVDQVISVFRLLVIYQSAAQHTISAYFVWAQRKLYVIKKE